MNFSKNSGFLGDYSSQPIKILSRYSELSNKHAANLILFEKKFPPACLIRTYTFIYFWGKFLPILQHVLPCYSWLKIECLWYCSKFVYQNSLMLCWCVKLLGKIQNVQILSFIFNFALRNSKRRLKIEVLRYCLKFVYQNSLMLCSCVKRLGNIRVVQFSDGFSSSPNSNNEFKNLTRKIAKSLFSLILVINDYKFVFYGGH